MVEFDEFKINDNLKKDVVDKFIWNFNIIILIVNYNFLEIFLGVNFYFFFFDFCEEVNFIRFILIGRMCDYVWFLCLL